MVISILAPSRGRPKKIIDTLIKWMDRAVEKTHRIIVSVDSDDPHQLEYYHNMKGLYSRNYSAFITERRNRSAVDAINHAASLALRDADIFIVVSDDTDCPERWDELILKEVEGKTDWILKTQDGIQPWIITMPVLDRAYYNRFGYIYHPDYLHMFCDTELSCVADLTGRRITSDLIFKHNHYSTGAFEKDAVSIKADATWNQGEKLFIERARNKFDLVNPPGKITSKEYINWARSKGVHL